MTHREWVALYFFFFTMQPHCISFHGQQGVSGTGFVFFTMQSHCISSHDQQVVSDTTFVFLYCVVSLHFIPWPTGGEWQCICFSLPCSLMIFHPMTNSLWVTVYLVLFTMQSHCTSSYYQQAVSDSAFIIFYHAISLYCILWPTGSEWQFICLCLPCSLSCCTSSHDKKYNNVSDIAFVFLYHAVSLHFIPWPTASEWQRISFALPCNLIAFHPMTNRMWVTVY